MEGDAYWVVGGKYVVSATYTPANEPAVDTSPSPLEYRYVAARVAHAVNVTATAFSPTALLGILVAAAADTAVEPRI